MQVLDRQLGKCPADDQTGVVQYGFIHPAVADVGRDFGIDGNRVGKDVQIAGDGHAFALVVMVGRLVGDRDHRPDEGLLASPFVVDFIDDARFSRFALMDHRLNH